MQILLMQTDLSVKACETSTGELEVALPKLSSLLQVSILRQKSSEGGWSNTGSDVILQ